MIAGVVRRNIARLNEDDTFDSSFHATGFGINGSVAFVALQQDGKIVISGGFTKYDNISRNYIARLNADGTLDQSFDPGTGADAPGDVVVQPDGKIIFAGGFTRYNNVPSNHVVRLNSNGSLDTTFRRGYEGPTTGISAVALQKDGKILIGSDFIARLNSDGSLDQTFEREAQLQSSEFGVVVFDILLQPDGRIVVDGFFNTYGEVSRNGILRLHPNGSLDASFDPGAGVEPYKGVGRAMLQPDGKIVIGGNFREFNGAARNGIARLQSDGALDGSFDPGTGVELRKVSSFGVVLSGALRPDGKILIGGIFDTYDGVARDNLAQILSAPTSPKPALLGNISTRARVGSGDNVLIGGFIVLGPEGSSKKVMIRAIGPSLSAAGLDGLPNTRLTLVNQADGRVIEENNDWKKLSPSETFSAERQASIEATGAAPSHDLESAIVRTLAPGVYTAGISDASGPGGTPAASGVALVEVYDLEQSSSARIANISTRGRVGLGQDVMIGGIIILGSQSSTVMVRAIGPSLEESSVANALQDPFLEVRDANGEAVAINDDWKTDYGSGGGNPDRAAIEATGIPPRNDRESALVATLSPAPYTAILRGGDPRFRTLTGVALVEVYKLQ